MDGPNWEQLLRNGQLVPSVPEHRVMLERFYLFFKGTADEQVFQHRYPAFYEEMNPKKVKVEKVEVEEMKEEVKPEKTKKTRKSSPLSNAK